MQAIASIIIALCIIALVVGLVKISEFYTRLLFASYVTNLAALMIVLLGSYKYNESYIDIALIYAALSFISNMAILRFIAKR
jgi:multisubunit Na+/H+ antiporter MnhF subunit